MAGIERRDREVRVSYCTNVHPGETVEEVSAALRSCAAPLARALRGELDLGVGLWLPRAAAADLARNESRLRALDDLLAASGLAVFTLNAFPFGGFHAARVKERVFVPSWAEEARLEYTADCGRILAALLPAGEQGSVSTLPLGHRAAGFGASQRGAAIANLRAAAAAYARLEDETGRRVVLCLEPEPGAALGTIREAARCLAREVFAGPDDPARRHLGVCLDACHEAVEFQEPREALRELQDAGVALGKVQATCALEIDLAGDPAEGLQRLRRFDEGRYLHQVCALRRDGQVEHFEDLGAFLAAAAGEVLNRDLERARVHFHVPACAPPGAGLSSTRVALGELLALAARAELVQDFEVETYTFDVIPWPERARLHALDLAGMLEQELRWTLQALARA